MFHYGCCMQWVDKGNEYCPYCRATMITSRAFYETALQVVGEERVAKLERINAEAAARVAQLTASGTTTIASPVPPVGQPPAQLAAGSSDEGGTATEPRAVAPVSESQEAPSSSEPASPVNAATSGQGSNYVEPPRSSEEDAVAKSGQASSVAASANKDSDNHVESSRSSREDDIVAESEIVDEAPSRIGTIE